MSLSSRQPDLITELSLTQSLLGTQGVIDALQNARASLNDVAIGYVFYTVNSQLNISVEDIGKTNSRSDLRKVAIGFYGYFLTGIFEYSVSKIYKCLPVKVPQQMIFLYSKIIKSAKIETPKTDIDRLVACHFNILDQNFKQYKKSN